MSSGRPFGESGQPVQARGGEMSVAEQTRTESPQTAEAARRQERLAWAVIWTSFLLCCAVIVAIPFGVIQYREAAMTTRGAVVEIIGGTVLLQPKGSAREVVASNKLQLVEGDRVRTTADSQALISLFDGSTIRLWPDTAVQLRYLRASSYTDNQVNVTIQQATGHLRVDVALPNSRERTFEVHTPHGSATLREGSYRISISDDHTELAVRHGSASVSGADQTVEILRHEQTTVAHGTVPTKPSPAIRNLVQNGDFVAEFSEWQRGSRNEEDGISGTTSLLHDSGRQVARFQRYGSEKHGETYLHQTINRDVTDYDVLQLDLDMKLVNQSLSGGGWVGSEYPLIVRVRYRDANHNEYTFVRGFYYQNVEGRPTTGGTKVLPGQWVPYSVDLFDPNTVSPRPVHVLWLEIAASGWDYESMVTNIQVLAE
ncbi:MAG TPA: FecR family protein [Chloroflexota bacterium]|nr:FecR family protein [Chloroflexota bacterium]